MQTSLLRAALGACLGLSAAASVPASGAGLSAGQTQWLQKANRHEKAGWTYLHVEGSPGEIGFQHGYLMAGEIAECLRVVRAEWLHMSSMDWDWLIANTSGFIGKGIDAESRAELEGIAEGMTAAGKPASYDDIATYNAWIELSGYWWPIAQKRLSDGIDVVQKPKDFCSSFIATGRMTRDGGIVLGHNTMDTYVEALAYVVIDIAPVRGHRILMQTQPGWIHSGTDFFVTDAGLVGSETTIDGFQHFSEAGVPEFVRMRRATQDAGDIDSWCAIMRKGNNGGYANAWLIGDTKTGEIARLELGLKYVGFERTMDGFYTGSNIAENLHILRLETDYGEKDTDMRLSSVARRVRWRQLMKENAGRIDLDVAARMEGDCIDPFLGVEKPSGLTLAGHGELSAEAAWTGEAPYSPGGTFDAKVVDTTLARAMSFRARWGSADGTAFDAEAFLKAHPQFYWMEGLLKSRPSEPWVDFAAGEKN